MWRPLKTLDRRERGQALVLFAAGLAGFLGLAGLAIDAGQLVVARTEMQKAADAAAFAGAEDLPSSGTATSTANSYVSANSGITTTAVQVSTTSQTNDTIRVTTTKRVNYTFLRVLGMTGADVSATARVRMRISTGFAPDEVDVFPYTVWGGARAAGYTNACPYNVCVGSSQVFRSNSFGSASHAIGPDWAVNGNNFKGYFHAGGAIVQIDPANWQTYSKGGNAVGQQPMAALNAHWANSEPIIVPVIKQASCNGGCGNIDFKIVAWVALRITYVGNPSQDWTGTVVEYHATPAGYYDGPNLPPASFPVVRTASLTE